MFTAAVLIPTSHARIVKEVRKEMEIPADFEKIAHHFTLHMGRANEIDLLGSHVTLIANSIAFNDKVIAVGLSEDAFCKTSNKNPHITIAVNRAAGGKPKDSNDLQDWKPIKPIVLFAVIEECF
jgi:hypothetical protein